MAAYPRRASGVISFRRIGRGRLRWGCTTAVLTMVLVGALPAPSRIVSAEDSTLHLAQTSVARGGWGPFLYSTQAPLQLLRFSYLHEEPQTVPAGTWALKSAATWTNTWDHAPDRYRVDYESLFYRFLVRYGLTHRLDVSLEVPVLGLGGGVLDRPIEAFHALSGLGNMERDRFQRDQIRIERYNADGTATVLMDAADAGWHLRAPVVSFRYRLVRLAPDVPVTLVAAMNLPAVTGEDRFLESNGRNWALGLATGGRVAGALAVNVSVAVIYPRDGSLRNGTLHWSGHVRSAMVSADYALDDAWALLAQLNYESPVGVGTRTAFDLGTYDILAGAKWLTAAGWRIELGLIENIIVHENNIDFGLHVGVSVPLS